MTVSRCLKTWKVGVCWIWIKYGYSELPSQNSVLVHNAFVMTSTQYHLFQVYHAGFFKACKTQKAVKEAFCFTKLIPNPTLSTFNMLMSVCASSQDLEGNCFLMFPPCWGSEFVNY